MEKWIAKCFICLSLVATQSNVVMTTNNTDSLLIAVGCKQFYDTSLKLWLELGTVKNTIRYTSIDQDVKNLVYYYAMYKLFMSLQGVTINVI